MKPGLAYALAFLLSGFLGLRGILPALTSMDTDFPNYYTASRLYLDGEDPARFYDDASFAGEIRRLGMNVEGKFSPFPPPTVFLMLPFAFLTPLNALRVWTFVNIVLLLGTIMILRRSTGVPAHLIACIALLCGIGLANNFRFGQWYVALLFLMSCGYFFWKKGSPVLAGIAFGLGATFKYFPALFFVLFVLRGEWRGAAALVATIVLANLAAAALTGGEMYARFFDGVFAGHVTGNIQNPYSASFQSWPSLFRRLFQFDEVLNPNPAVRWPAGAWIGTAVVFLIVVLSTLRILIAEAKDKNELGIQCVLVTMMGLLLLPASATYHFVLLILPMTILLSYREKLDNMLFMSLLAAYCCLGFLPYSLFRTFEGAGAVGILSFPRLGIMAAMFMLTHIAASRMLGASSVSAS